MFSVIANEMKANTQYIKQKDESCIGEELRY